MTDSTPRAPDGPALLGPAFYDHEKVFDAYRAGRTLPDNPNTAMEEPPVIEFLGDLGGRAVLDLGCGDARFGRYALDSGALRYVGIDASNRMLEVARRNLRGTRGQVQHADLRTWSGFEAAGFDVVVSRLALHYVEDLDRLLTVVHRCLVPGGLFVLSVEHPVVTSTYDGTDVEEGFAYEWRVRDYFVEGGREDPWLGAVAHKVHRTFETYVRALRDAGFRLDALSEATPRRESFHSAQIFELRRQVPAYAIFRCLRDP